MKPLAPAIALTIAALTLQAQAERKTTILTDNWIFNGTEMVTVPHDWAIYGPFDRANDLQTVAVEQNGEKEETVKTARTGGLPFIGKGCYETSFIISDPATTSVSLLIEGAMSNATVWINGQETGHWPYGYNSFYLDIDPYIKDGVNTLRIDLENKERASRWYPGAGLYRNVKIIETDKIHIPVWGTYITTPKVASDYAVARLEMKIAGLTEGQKVDVCTDILNPDGNVVATNRSTLVAHGQNETQNFLIDNPILWSPESPALYKAVTTLTSNDKAIDSYTTTFGIRTIEYIPEKGFFINGKATKFRGVCNHHDLGPLGAAVNRSAIRHQLNLLKEMGCNAIRTSHNMPAPELVELCDEMGIMLMIEPFDDWGFRPKSPNGYGASFDQWWDKDITNMIEHYRNNPSVVMWSIGNEVPSQWGPDGVRELKQLQDLVHLLDPTRPVTCGMDQINSVLYNGFAAALDIPGFNYKPQWYDQAHNMLPQKLILGSETASTVSSRGVYKFPLVFLDHEQIYHDDNQCSSYDNEACYWSNIPDLDFFMDDYRDWVIGQFVWTGFDYLGEPSPYDTDAWPNHSSMFGIIDLASLPKDRFWLYRSQWRKDSPTFHVLPHWNWPERIGKVTPVMVYTSYPEAELWINGVSQGRKAKKPVQTDSLPSTMELVEHYRIFWDNAIYTPGEIKVIAYDEHGNPAAEQTIKTAGKPKKIMLSTDSHSLKPDGVDLAYVTVTVVDKDGIPVPTASNMVKFEVTGEGRFVATANGDPKCLLPFQRPEMELFSGACTAIISSGKQDGSVTLKVTGKGLQPATITIPINE